METCICNSRLLCAYDLKDINGIYDSRMVEDWKRKAAGMMLRCEECQKPVYLGAGPIKEPYFAHFSKEQCSYSSIRESEVSKKSTRLIYNILKRSFNNNDITLRYKCGGLYLTAAVLNKSNPDRIISSVDFRLQSISITEFENRNEKYNSYGVCPLYIIGFHNIGSNNQFVWYLNMIQKIQGFAIILNAKEEELIIYYRYESYGNVKLSALYKETFDIARVIFTAENDVIVDNTTSIRLQIKKFINNKREYVEKLRYEKEYENDERRKRLATKEREEQIEKGRIEEQLRLDTEEAGLNYTIIKNAITHILNGEEYLVSSKYRDYIYSKRLI